MTLDAALNGTLSDVQTDVQNVPIDRVSDTHKLLILLIDILNKWMVMIYNY